MIGTCGCNDSVRCSCIKQLTYEDLNLLRRARSLGWLRLRRTGPYVLCGSFSLDTPDLVWLMRLAGARFRHADGADAVLLDGDGDCVLVIGDMPTERACRLRVMAAKVGVSVIMDEAGLVESFIDGLAGQS